MKELITRIEQQAVALYVADQRLLEVLDEKRPLRKENAELRGRVVELEAAVSTATELRLAAEDSAKKYAKILDWAYRLRLTQNDQSPWAVEYDGIVAVPI